MPSVRRSFLKLLASGFAAVLGVKIGDARMDQMAQNHPFPIDPIVLEPKQPSPLMRLVIEQRLTRRTPNWIPWTERSVRSWSDKVITGEYEKWLEAGSEVESEISGHEPDVIPFHYPATHGSTKGDPR